MTKKPKHLTPRKDPTPFQRVGTLGHQVAVLTEQRDLVLKTLDQDIRERAKEEIYRRACRGTQDRAALKCVVAGLREVLVAVEALIRGSET